jgi:hypothetical protein
MGTLITENSVIATHSSSPQLEVTGPKDFSEGGGDHRKSTLATTALILALLMSTNLKPQVFGVEVSVPALWAFLGLAHVYFFIMWRLTTTIEAESENRFWNLKGLWKQATASGTRGFPGKTKAQLLFIRALPIWAFLIGIVGIVYGLWAHYHCV